MKDLRIRSTGGGDGYVLEVETDIRFNNDGTRREIVTDWYFSANERVARVCRYERFGDSYLNWMFQFRPHPQHPRDNNYRHGLQFDHRTRDPQRGAIWTPVPTEIERELWRQGHAAALAWVLRREIVPGGLWGWTECGDRLGVHRAVMGPMENPSAPVRRAKR